MKQTKKLLAMVLTITLAFSLAMPAMAAVNWDEFRITKQPPKELLIKHGDSFTLSVEVSVPTAVEVEYQWYNDHGSKIEGATGPELHLGPDNSQYPEYDRLGGEWERYECRITAYEKDDDGNVLSSRNLRSDSATVLIELTILGRLYGITLAPFGLAFAGPILMLPLAFIYPISFLGFLIYGYIEGFIGLFTGRRGLL